MDCRPIRTLGTQRVFSFFGFLFQGYEMNDMSNEVFETSHTHPVDFSRLGMFPPACGARDQARRSRVGFWCGFTPGFSMCLLKFHHSNPAVISLPVIFCLTLYKKINSPTAEWIMILTQDCSQLPAPCRHRCNSLVGFWAFPAWEFGFFLRWQQQGQSVSLYKFV